jgi:hypothetical protein
LPETQFLANSRTSRQRFRLFTSRLVSSPTLTEIQRGVLEKEETGARIGHRHAANPKPLRLHERVDGQQTPPEIGQQIEPQGVRAVGERLGRLAYGRAVERSISIEALALAATLGSGSLATLSSTGNAAGSPNRPSA